MIWLEMTLAEQSLTIARLKKVFGIKTESAKKLFKMAKAKSSSANSSEVDGSDTTGNSTEGTLSAEGSSEATEKANESKEKGHGHRPSSDYQEAEIVAIAHDALAKGAICPGCGKGKLYNLSPGTVLHIIGQPWLKIQLYGWAYHFP